MLSKGPDLNLDLSSLVTVLRLNFFAASAGQVTLVYLSSVAGRSREQERAPESPFGLVRQVW